MYVYNCTHAHIYIYIQIFRYVYVYEQHTYIYIRMCVYMYVFIFIRVCIYVCNGANVFLQSGVAVTHAFGIGKVASTRFREIDITPWLRLRHLQNCNVGEGTSAPPHRCGERCMGSCNVNLDMFSEFRCLISKGMGPISLDPLLFRCATGAHTG